MTECMQQYNKVVFICIYMYLYVLYATIKTKVNLQFQIKKWKINYNMSLI